MTPTPMVLVRHSTHLLKLLMLLSKSIQATSRSCPDTSIFWLVDWSWATMIFVSMNLIWTDFGEVSRRASVSFSPNVIDGRSERISEHKCSCSSHWCVLKKAVWVFSSHSSSSDQEICLCVRNFQICKNYGHKKNRWFRFSSAFSA